jgi:hypothetical protein
MDGRSIAGLARIDHQHRPAPSQVQGRRKAGGAASDHHDTPGPFTGLHQVEVAHATTLRSTRTRQQSFMPFQQEQRGRCFLGAAWAGRGDCPGGRVQVEVAVHVRTE